MHTKELNTLERRMFFVEKSLLMRTIYNPDINSSHVDRELIAQDKASFIDHKKPTPTSTREKTSKHEL